MSSAAENFFPKAKIAAITQFESIANKFYPKRHPDMVFPPPSWHIEELEKGMGGNASPGDETKSAVINEQSNLAVTSDSEQTTGGTGVECTRTTAATEHDPADNPPEPITLAQKLKQLIEHLPVPPAVTTAFGGTSKPLSADATRTENQLPPIDNKGPPIPEGVDPETMRLLSSKRVMAGTGNQSSTDTPSGRQSVWAALEKLKPSSWDSRQPQSTESKEKKPSDSNLESEEAVMMCSPLQPDSSSEVELAECVSPGVPSADKTSEASREVGKQEEATGKATTAPSVPTSPPIKKIWVPSTTNISIYTTWWGYRLYLPPPVMEILGSNQMKATKRATVITTALQWFLMRIPVAILPVNVKGPVTLLRRLAPLVGYIGVFIAWSWTRINAVDEGNGVVLTATWLLPVALIPTAWDAGDIQGPHNQPVFPNSDSSKKAEPKQGESNGIVKAFTSKLDEMWNKK